MNVIVRLYWQHDLDLIALAKHPDFEIGRQMKKAVIAFVRGDDSFVIPLPRPQPYQVKLVNCDTHFILTYNDEDVIQYFKNFRYGVRNSAIKQIFRMYLERPNLQVFYDDPIYVTKARGKCRKYDSEEAMANISWNSQKTANQKELSETALKKHVRPSLPTDSRLITPKVEHNPEVKIDASFDESTSALKKNASYSSLGSIKDTPDELDLSREETDNIEGTSFNLFAAVDKLM